MYNELFESIIQASNENMDDINNSADGTNFYARISENLLFEQILRESPLMDASKTANGSLYAALDKWYFDENDDRTLYGCLQDYVSKQNVSSNSPFMPAYYKTNIGNFISKPPKETNKQKIKSEMVATEPNSKERKFWVDEIINQLKKKFTYNKNENYLSDNDYTTIEDFFLNIESNAPQNNYTTEVV